MNSQIYRIFCFILLSRIGFGQSSMDLDSPIIFPKDGVLPALFTPDININEVEVEPVYFFFKSPCRSVNQINEIQSKMPTGRYDPIMQDWGNLSRLKKNLNSKGKIKILGLGDSIINDFMRSGWLNKLQEAYPACTIDGAAYVRGNGGCQYFKEQNRIENFIIPWAPDVVLLGGISQQDISSIETVIDKIRSYLPDTEFIISTGSFGKKDPRNPKEMIKTSYAATSKFGMGLRQLAVRKKCAFLDICTPWSAYILSSQLHPYYFYRDQVHANEYGEQILSKIIMDFLKPL